MSAAINELAAAVRESLAQQRRRADDSWMHTNPDPMPAKVAPPKPGRTFQTATLADCAERGPQWLVQRLMEQGCVAAVTGEPGSAKTFLLIDLALHVSAGRDWFGRKVQRGAVIYIAAEAHESVKRRLALARRVKFGDVELPLIIVTEPALLGDEHASAIDRQALDRLVDELAVKFGVSVALIIVDTIAASMGTGNENLDGMQRLVGAANMLATATGATVVLNHHPSTGGAALRGHSSLRGTVSHGFQIEVKGDVRVVCGFKQRDTEAGRLFAYRLDVYDLAEPDNFGDRAQSCVVAPTDMPMDDDRTEQSELTRLALAARDAFQSEGVVRFGDVVKHCRAACEFLSDKSEDAVRKAVSRALRQLTDAGAVIRCDMPRGAYRLPTGSGQ